MKEIDIAPGGPVIKLQLFSYPLIKEKKTTLSNLASLNKLFPGVCHRLGWNICFVLRHLTTANSQVEDATEEEERKRQEKSNHPGDDSS